MDSDQDMDSNTRYGHGSGSLGVPDSGAASLDNVGDKAVCGNNGRSGAAYNGDHPAASMVLQAEAGVLVVVPPTLLV
ncbi:hypothetical protein Pcinc_027022 [Petrolisthes cinctipes]|uniref:Uncharacterized protein n=1 Tax=Petrolisthes cinctipes TaxID=88211 RepID=A0AAE1F4U4_PETCI|nr:hypothetical protein Pcinc_027022 [Petrolisthes cinctipes]